MRRERASLGRNSTTPAPAARRARLLLAGSLAAAVAGATLLWWTQAGRRAPPSLLLVTIDTLRADRVGAYGHVTAATPVMDGLARRGTRFAKAQSAVPLTGPSHATLFTGLYPPSHGVRDNVTFILDARHRALATRLKAAGYATAAFVGAYPVAADFGFGRGFDHYSQRFHESRSFGAGAERPANEVADDVVAWLGVVGRGPFFAWAHFYDPHAPYAPPDPYRSQFSGRPYDGEVAFTDAQLGRVLAALDAAGRSARTLVAVVSDHGEGLGDHGEATHGVLTYESTLHVPLILAGPGVPSGHVVEQRVGTADLLPTLLDLLGQPALDGLQGRSLRPALAGERLPAQPLYGESLFGRLNCRWATLRTWTAGDWKLIDGAEPELFDLASDPAERVNRAGQERERVSQMRDSLGVAVARMAPSGDSARTVTISAEQEERLRSLGYAGASGGAQRLDEPGLPDPRTHASSYDRLQSVLGARGPAAVSLAMEEAAGMTQADPGNPFAHYVLASLAYRAGRLPLAEAAFARTLELDPDRPGMRHHYGRLLRDIGKLEESERQLRIAVEQAPASDTSLRMNLASTLIARGRVDEAERLVRPVLEAEPEHVEAHAAMGRLLVARGRAPEALPHLEQAAREGATDGRIELAGALIETGRPGDARQILARVLEGSPEHPWALAVMGHALALEGRPADALHALHRARAIGPRRPEVWLALARAFEAAGDRVAAAACRRQAMTEPARTRP